MYSSDLRQGCTYSFDVVKEASGNKSFKVKTDDGLIFSLLKFKFQKERPIPDKLSCYVKSLYPLSLGQDVALYINEFYEEGKEYNFKVKSIKNDPDVQYELEDKYGLCFKLFSSPVPLSKGSRVKCRVIKIKDAYVNLKYVGILSNRFPLQFRSIPQWVKQLHLRKPSYYYKTLLKAIPEFESALTKYREHDASWIIDVLQICSENVPNWMISCKNDFKRLKVISDRLESARSVTLYILEQSDFLRACTSEQRSNLQQRLSNYVELFEQYKLAASKILDNSHEEYIDRMFDRLKQAGYLYKPSRQIRIMMTILKLRPELINKKMGELFETLHSWDVSNWQSEPFRSALIEQLQIFIEENTRQVNHLPVSDSNIYNNKLSRMILAIAVQRILALESDNIDLNLNRAMLYRYISYLYPAEINVLLNKEIDVLLGIDYPNEFTWEDTENPTVLFNKSQHPAPLAEDRDIISKSYLTSKCEIRLTPEGLHLIATDADSETTVIPNNMFDWMDIRISLADPLYSNLNNKKDLKIYKNFWDEISRNIMRSDDKDSKTFEKRFPEEGDTVNVIIDGYRINDIANEKQRLQFHCTIVDDLYYGNGWLPCDTFHMVGWFSHREVSSKNTEMINFAYDDESPLLYKANISKRKDKELEFSMKTQIEEFLMENFYPGEETVAIVTSLDKKTNDWICLSEGGASFKIPNDDAYHISEGDLVRIKYVEIDNSSANSLYFMAELSENQENLPATLKKSECLYNLMQSIGTAVEEKPIYEVMETTQVLTKDEMTELICILQRRASSESEYLKAFNYLGLAKTLCRIVEDEMSISEIDMHMGLLQVLQDFSRDRKIDFETLSIYEEKVKDYPMLERLYTRLKIVASLENNEGSSWLLQMRQSPRNETESNLASLVLSYNLLPDELNPMKKQIMEQIAKLLNVNSSVPKSKYYGVESQIVEFKSSLIYSTKGGSKPDPEGQLFEITHIICGFMNAKGGTLYIGVNDSGYENGLDDDLAFRKQHKKPATLDALSVYLQNHLDRVLPFHAKDKFEISIDPESKKGVIKVEIKPVRQPVELNDIIYVRSGSTTKPRLNEEREAFIKERPHNYQILMALMGVETNGQNEDEPDENNSKESLNEGLSENSEKQPYGAVTQFDNDWDSLKLKMGRQRKNILHEHQDDFVSPEFYLYLYSDNTVTISSEDLWYDSDLDCILAMAVKHNETQGVLLLTCNDGSILKYELDDISTLPDKKKHKSFTNKTFTHANIGMNEDYLLTIFKNISGSILYRIDKISDIPTSTLSSPELFKFHNSHNEVIEQEVISTKHLSFFDEDALKVESHYGGLLLPMGDGTLTQEERINAILRPLSN